VVPRRHSASWNRVTVHRVMNGAYQQPRVASLPSIFSRDCGVMEEVRADVLARSRNDKPYNQKALEHRDSMAIRERGPQEDSILPFGTEIDRVVPMLQ
jgi:hypothetical protein